MLKDNDVMVVIFSKEQVRRCKTAHFLKQFGRDALPQGPALAELMNRFRFLVHGYDDDPQELYAIPKVQTSSSRIWPCSFSHVLAFSVDGALARTMFQNRGVWLASMRWASSCTIT